MKQITLLALLALCSLTLLAQKRQACTVEYETGEKQNYYFDGKLVNLFGFDYKSTLTFYSYLSSEKIKVKIEEIKEITLTNEEEESSTVIFAKAYKGTPLGKPSKNLSEKSPFLVLYRDDDITLAKQRVIVTDQTTTTYDYYYFLKKGEIYPKFILVEAVGGTIGWETAWKNSLARYFEDCPPLVTRIKNGEFNVKYKDFGIENLIKLYKVYLSYQKK